MKDEVILQTPFLTAFFDTSFLSEASLEDLRYCLDFPGPKYITDGVYREIKEGYSYKPNDKRFSYIFEKNGKLKTKIKTILLGKCIKDLSMVDCSQRNILFKRNSLLCSAYYTWLNYAINPSIVTDPFRHMYNNVLHMIREKGIPEIS